MFSCGINKEKKRGREGEGETLFHVVPRALSFSSCVGSPSEDCLLKVCQLPPVRRTTRAHDSFRTNVAKCAHRLIECKVYHMRASEKKSSILFVKLKDLGQHLH